MKDLVVILEPPGKASSWTVKAIVDMYQKNGLRAIFSGLVPRVIKIAPACAIMVSTFEYGKTFFQNRNMQVYTNFRDIS